LKTATSKITPAFQTLGGTMKNSIGNLRNTSMFKSIEGIGSWVPVYFILSNEHIEIDY
jgi:hypothetical protein